jgi:hypothetical protein
MGLIRFKEFNRVNESRVVVNNAMVALLAGSRLASHTLNLTSGSPQLLPQIFPRVANIDRFNLVPDQAKALLDAADQHVAAVSVPYALSVHEDFTMAIIEMVRTRGTPIVVPGRRKLGPATMHETLFTALGYPYPSLTLEIFHVLREMRNSQIHEGGRANKRFIALVATMSLPAQALWLDITGSPHTDAIDHGRVAFSLGQMFLAFATTKRLAREINVALQAHWTSAQWASLLVRDYQEQTSHLRNSSSWRRSLIGYAQLEYGPLALSESEIEGAARSSGDWTTRSW